MIIIFGEREKSDKAKYQQGAIQLEALESIQVEASGLIITNYSRHNMYVVSSNQKLSASMKTRINSDNDGSGGPTGLLN